MNHLINCHGEWNALFAFASSMPIMGAWITMKIGGKRETTKNK